MIEHETTTRVVQQFNYKEDFRLKKLHDIWILLTWGPDLDNNAAWIVILYNISANATV